MATIISRWGNSLGVRIPKEALERAHLHEGDEISIEATDHGVLLRSAKPQLLEELIAAIRPENLHDETSTGAPVGNEIW